MEIRDSYTESFLIIIKNIIFILIKLMPHKHNIYDGCPSFFQTQVKQREQKGEGTGCCF